MLASLSKTFLFRSTVLEFCSTMKVLRKFVLFIMIGFVFCQNNKIISSAINEIFVEYFAKDLAKVDIVYYGNKTGPSEDLIEEVLLHKTDSVSVQVSKGGTENAWRNQLNISSLLVFDSADIFKESFKHIKWLSNKRRHYRHLVYSPNLKVSDIVENIEDEFFIDHVSFIMNVSNTTVNIMSGFMFTPNKCRKSQFVTINTFEQRAMKWENHQFFPKKYRNFHGCNLTLNLHFTLKNNPQRRSIPTLYIFEEFSKIFNFKIDYKFEDTGTFLGKTELFRADLRYLDHPFDGDLFHITTVPYAIERAAFTVPPGEPYTPFEKLFMPFEIEVWIAICVSFIIGVSTIWIISLAPIKMQNFLFGSNIRTPILNMVDIFINGGQFKVPGRNFARFFLMLFIIWSLIIRTCYQSELFKRLQSDDRKPRVKSSIELLEKNFTWFMLNVTAYNKDIEWNRK